MNLCPRPTNPNHSTSRSIRRRGTVEGMGKHFLSVVAHVCLLWVQGTSPFGIRITKELEALQGVGGCVGGLKGPLESSAMHSPSYFYYYQWIRRLEAALLKASCHVGHEELWVRHQKVSQNQQCSDFTHGFPTVPGVEKVDRTSLLKFPKHRMTFQSQLAS